MAVAVVSRTGVPLMPTSPYRARKLLASGKAEKYGYDPFTIRLTERETGDTQPVELCMDTGYIHIGVSVKSEKHEYLALQIDTLTDEKKKHEKCREKRRNRRSRKRYRKPRFDNRKRDKGWLAPSLEHKKEIHVRAAERICRVVPVTDITMEMGNFDTQVLKAREKGRPLPQGTDYQQGERYGTATLREAVFSRDNYTCLCCGRTMKDGAYFHVHHIRYRSQGGTDRMANLATVCEKCHTPANHQPGGKLYNWKPEIKSFKGATFMTAVRWQMYREIKEKIPDISVHLTYGAATKERRRALDIEKSHVNDAFVMGRFHPGHRARPELYIKKRRNNRVLESFYDARYIDSRDGKRKSGKELFNGRISRNHKKDSENLHKYRLRKVSKTANAGYNNYTKYARDVDDYYQGDPWCAMFISWCMMKTYGRNTAKKLLKDWPYVACRYLPYYLPSYNTPKKGDIVLFYNGSDYEHTGLVTKVQGARFWTIEGNTKKITEVIPEGYCVCEKSYYIKTLPKVKFCRPQYQIAV